MTRLEELYNKMIDEAPFTFPESNKPYLLQLANIYATECSKASLEKASTNAKITKTSCGDSMQCGCMGNCEYPISNVNRRSINNDENITLL